MIMVGDDKARSLANMSTEHIVENIERDFMPNGRCFSEEQWERISSEVFDGVYVAVRGMQIDPEDYDK